MIEMNDVSFSYWFEPKLIGMNKFSLLIQVSSSILTLPKNVL